MGNSEVFRRGSTGWTIWSEMHGDFGLDGHAKRKLRLRSKPVSVNAFYEKVIKVKADVAAFLINCFPSA